MGISYFIATCHLFLITFFSVTQNRHTMKKLLLPIVCISFLLSCGDDKPEKKTIIAKVDSTVVVKTDDKKKQKSLQWILLR